MLWIFILKNENIMAYKGRFRPKNPGKYKGDPSNIIYRSSWELKVFRRLDEHPDVIEWSSEEVSIPYVNPVRSMKAGERKISRYFPDIIVKKRMPNNEIVTMMIEIKPKSQTAPPDPAKRNATKSGRVSRRYLNEAATYSVNEAKWEAARRYCKERGMEFVIMTEEHIKPLGK
jgi:hypothetical protein